MKLVGLMMSKAKVEPSKTQFFDLSKDDDEYKCKLMYDRMDLLKLMEINDHHLEERRSSTRNLRNFQKKEKVD